MSLYRKCMWWVRDRQIVFARVFEGNSTEKKNQFGMKEKDRDNISKNVTKLTNYSFFFLFYVKLQN